MAVSHSTTLPARKSYRRQALIWLLMTLILGVITALVWMFSQTPVIGTKIENAPISMPEATVEELKQPLSIESLHELDTDVQPIDFAATVRDLRNYPDEFKDKRYLSANKGKWTVQIMNVAENDVVVSYLEGRKDRGKFAYFRYLDENKQVRYMLTYGVMSSPQEAVGAAKLIDFGLPADVSVLPEEINRYVSIIDNYERPEPIKDLSTRRARSVNLQRTKREVPVRQKAQAQNSSNTTATETNTQDQTERSSSNSDATTPKANSAESIRQSADTSETLSINEERSFDTDDGSTAKPRKPEAETKKPPVVATPKPPTPAKPPAATNNPAPNKNTNDSIKELIDQKTN